MTKTLTMDDQSCPKCKTTKYRNPSLKLLVNVCGHALCENCVELLFVRGSGSCPQCDTPLRRSNFRVQLFEDAAVEKEVDIRKRILKDFNKREEDFTTLREFNDYLEQVETIIFNLANGVDVEETKRKVEQYKKENKDFIAKNQYKLSKDEEYLEMLIEEEREQHEFLRQQALQEDLQERRDKRKNKEALIDELMFSDLPANHILAAHRQEVNKQAESSASRERLTQFSSGIRVGKLEPFQPVPKTDEGELFVYSPYTKEYCGPNPPEINSIETEGYLHHIRSASDQDKGGGYVAQIACQRALQDAFCGLFFVPESVESRQSALNIPMDI